MKKWLVEHPLYQYKEDVKLLALKANLQIVDKQFEASINKGDIETDTPKLTKIKTK